MTSISAEAAEQIRIAAIDRSTVKGATHQFYRYPARFSPQFAKTVIEAFTSKGDLVMDPFVGGGTTVVEAMRMGRTCIGSDINELALFICKVKSTVLGRSELELLKLWFPSFKASLKINQSTKFDHEWRVKGYFRHIETQETWRYRNIIQIALHLIDELPSKRLADFVRCAILRTAQLALDGRKTIMTLSEFRAKLEEHFYQMVMDMETLQDELAGLSLCPLPHLIKSNAASLHKARILTENETPKLILTSPPYPGVHVLYHRWQVKGRRETSVPYWIADKLDGDGERYYTLGNRYEKKLRSYFSNLEAAFKSIASIAGPETTIVQMVAFSEPEWQLQQYLEVMQKVGLKELHNLDNYKSRIPFVDGRIWRDVPNRKWHAQRQTQSASSREVILFHTLA